MGITHFDFRCCLFRFCTVCDGCCHYQSDSKAARLTAVEDGIGKECATKQILVDQYSGSGAFGFMETEMKDLFKMYVMRDGVKRAHQEQASEFCPSSKSPQVVCYELDNEFSTWRLGEYVL